MTTRSPGEEWGRAVTARPHPRSGALPHGRNPCERRRGAHARGHRTEARVQVQDGARRPAGTVGPPPQG
ncbi:hypothetical protein [Streptomyces sp. NPDC090445]|uniref:hypothetical protein n=1 Tax=Streptomyces sp. NPDC090445 TaxID=3365963 RepID=UPI0038099ABD